MMAVTHGQFKKLIRLIRNAIDEGFQVYLKINRLYSHMSKDADIANDPYVKFASAGDEYILLSNGKTIIHGSIVTSKYNELRNKFYIVKQL